MIILRIAMVATLPSLLFASACAGSCGRVPSRPSAQTIAGSTFIFPLAREALVVPFPVHGACAGNEIFLNVDAGIAVESVLADGKAIAPERSLGFAVNDPQPVRNVAGFIYLRHGNVLYSFAAAGGDNELPTVLRFTIPVEDQFVNVKAIDVRYRVRCPSGTVSGLMSVLGRRDDVSRD